jgi:ArsR family transcriptional regulator, virulence genes transcriptional regulator
MSQNRALEPQTYRCHDYRCPQPIVELFCAEVRGALQSCGQQDRRHRDDGHCRFIGLRLVSVHVMPGQTLKVERMPSRLPEIDRTPKRVEPAPDDAELSGLRDAANDAADMLRAIGSPHRLMILCYLMERERTVTEICEAIGARQSLISQHLTRLRLDGLVKAERRGHFAYYSLTDTPAKDIVTVLYRHFCRDRLDHDTDA